MAQDGVTPPEVEARTIRAGDRIRWAGRQREVTVEWVCVERDGLVEMLLRGAGYLIVPPGGTVTKTGHDGRTDRCREQRQSQQDWSCCT